MRFREWLTFDKKKSSFLAKRISELEIFPQIICLHKTAISMCSSSLSSPGLASRSCYTHGIISDFHGGGKQKMAPGLSYIRAVRLRHITTAGPGFGYSRGFSGFLSPAPVISFPSVSCFQMIWDERLFDILSPGREERKLYEITNILIMTMLWHYGW